MFASNWILPVLVLLGIAAAVFIVVLRGRFKSVAPSFADVVDGVGEKKSPQQSRQWPEWKLMLPSTVTSLRGVPEGVTDIEVCHAPNLRDLSGLPSSVHSVVLIHCDNLKNLAGLPGSVERLQIHNCPQISNLDGLSLGLKLITITFCDKLNCLRGLPSGVQMVGLLACGRLTTLTDLPSTVQGLICDRTWVTSFAGLPPRAVLLTHWERKDNELSSCTLTPTSLLQTIRAERARITGGPFGKFEMPKTAKSLEGLPQTIIHLRVHNNHQLANLIGAPGSLKVVELDCCYQLTSLEGLPAGVEVLALRECRNLQSLQYLPPSIRHVMVVDCPNLTHYEGIPTDATISTKWDHALLIPLTWEGWEA